MAAENAGTSKISLELDLANWTTSVDGAKRQITGLGTAAETAFDQSNSKSKTAAVSLAKYIELIGKSADQTKILRTQWAGIDGTVLTELVGRLQRVRDEEAATAQVTAMMGQSWTDMQAKAKAAYKELQSTARDEQLMREKAALDAVTSATAAAAAQQRNFATAVNNTAQYAGVYGERVQNMRDAVAAFTTGLDEQRASAISSASALAALAAQQTANASAAVAASERITNALVAERTARENALNVAQTTNTSAARQAYERQQAAIRAERAQAALNDATKKGGITFDKYGLSAKQTAAALRQVPAQITDIFVSLQGGQRPLTVLLQQGGQLKDVFGGVVPAVRALSAALLGLLLNPVVLVAAAVAALAYAWKSGNDEQNAFNQSLALTGNYAGKTTGQLNDMAASIGRTVSNQHAAAAALALVAGNGKLTADNFELISSAAEQMRLATGKAVKDTVAEFATLAGDPAKAVAKLNEAQHFLTSAVYEQIDALQKQGRVREAQSLAEKTYADALATRATNIVENLGYIEKAWRGIAGATKAAISAAAGVGRAETDSDVFGRLTKDLERYQAAQAKGIKFDVNSGQDIDAAIASVRTRMAKLQEARKTADTKASQDAALQRANDAAIALKQESDKYRTAKQKQTDEINAINQQAADAIADAGKNTSLVATIEKNRDAAIAGIKAKATGDHGLANAQADAQLQAIKNTQTKEQAEIANGSKVLKAEYEARNITASDYYSKQRSLIEQDTAAQEKSLLAQIAYLKSRDVSGKDSVKTTKEIGEAEAKLAKARADGAAALAVSKTEQAAYDKQRMLSLQSYQDSLDDGYKAAQMSANAQLAAIMNGQREAEVLQKKAELTDKYAKALRDLDRDRERTGDMAAFNERAAALKADFDRTVALVDDTYSRIDAAQADWLNGVNTGIADWMQSAADVAGQVAAITGRTMDSLVDHLDSFFETGTFGLKSFLRDMASEIAKFMAKKAIMQFVLAFAGSSANGFGFQGGTSASTFAKGESFSNSPSLSAYSGTVVNQPTPFLFAKGVGIMGEAGEEGILPLERDSRGRLGVTAQGIGGGGVTLNLALTVNSDGSSNTESSSSGEQAALYKSFMGDVASMVDGKLQRAMMPGGALWKAGVAA